LLEQFDGPNRRIVLGQLVEPSEEDQVFSAGQVFIDRRVLPGNADQAPEPLSILHNIESEDRGVARIGLQQGRQDPDRGRFARPVRAEQAEYAPFIDGQIESVERPYLGLATAVNLHQAFGHDDRLAASRNTPFRWR